MDALRIGEFFSNRTMNCQTVVLLLRKIHSSLLICNQFCLACLGGWFFYYQIRDSGGKKVRSWFNIHTTNTQRINTVLKNYDLIYVHVDASALDEVVSLV